MGYAASGTRIAASENLALALPDDETLADRTVEMFQILMLRLVQGQFAIDGDVALRYHAINAGRVEHYREFDRMVVAIIGRMAVDHDITRDLLIAHHHAGGEHPDTKPYFNITVVQPDHGTTALLSTSRSAYGVMDVPLLDMETPIPLATPQTMLATRVWHMRQIVYRRPVDRTLVEDAEFLYPFAYDSAAEAAWREFEPPGNFSLAKVYEESVEAAAAHPELLVDIPQFSRPVSIECSPCNGALSPDFPLARPGRIYRLWGLE
ncbi:MAG TPA: hypothetical protein VLG47_05355 [Candidatus Saccharimonadales bacterium]|nr:hypothetical protein [Candidatus Saccharimonadales bacterium]